MRIFALLIGAFVCVGLRSHGQELSEVNQKTDYNLVASYHILKSKPDVKWGAYLLFNRKNKMAVVSGTYKDNQRVGIWRFFDNKGKPLQMYDFTAKQLRYEAPENDYSPLKYLFDVPFTATDTLTKPIRIGGRYYGYLPYANIFVVPQWFATAEDPRAVLELLISPGGRLAEYNIHLNGIVYNAMLKSEYSDVLHVNLNTLANDDKIFIPATKNGEPVASRIVINADFQKGKLLLYK